MLFSEDRETGNRVIMVIGTSTTNLEVDSGDSGRGVCKTVRVTAPSWRVVTFNVIVQILPSTLVHRTAVV